VHFIELEHKQSVMLEHFVDCFKITSLDLPHEGPCWFTPFEWLFGEDGELAEELSADFHLLR